MTVYWTESETQELMRLYGTMKASAVAKCIGRSRCAVIGKIRRLRLNQKIDRRARALTLTDYGVAA